jgi:hypothetical protein
VVEAAARLLREHPDADRVDFALRVGRRFVLPLEAAQRRIGELEALVERRRADAARRGAEADRLSGALDVMHAQQLRTEDERDDARREVERLRSEQFQPGPIVQESSLFGGYQVRCLGCSAGTLTGFETKASAETRAAKHVHVHPDGDGYVDDLGAWPR